jgi:hypothetical protein
VFLSKIRSADGEYQQLIEEPTLIFLQHFQERVEREQKASAKPHTRIILSRSFFAFEEYTPHPFFL